ncbi:hypothetical protein PC39_04467 [Salinisphaera sp. PC39]
MLGAVTEDDLQAIAQGLVGAPKDGDVQATKLLFSYVVGRPTASPNPDRTDIEVAELGKQCRSVREDERIGEILKGLY